MSEGEGRKERTCVGIIVHDGDPVDKVRESRYVLHRLTVLTDKSGVLHGSGYQSTCGELLLEDFEELKHVIGIGCAFGITLLDHLTWVLPVDVDAVEIEALVDLEDVVGKNIPGLCGCDCV